MLLISSRVPPLLKNGEYHFIILFDRIFQILWRKKKKLAFLDLCTLKTFDDTVTPCRMKSQKRPCKRKRNYGSYYVIRPTPNAYRIGD